MTYTKNLKFIIVLIIYLEVIFSDSSSRGHENDNEDDHGDTSDDEQNENQGRIYKDFWSCADKCEGAYWEKYFSLYSKEKQSLRESILRYENCVKQSSSCEKISKELRFAHYSDVITENSIETFKMCFEGCKDTIKEKILFNLYACEQKCFGNDTQYVFKSNGSNSAVIFIIIIVVLAVILIICFALKCRQIQKQKKAIEIQQQEIQQQRQSQRIQRSQTSKQQQKEEIIDMQEVILDQECNNRTQEEDQIGNITDKEKVKQDIKDIQIPQQDSIQGYGEQVKIEDLQLNMVAGESGQKLTKVGIIKSQKQ